MIYYSGGTTPDEGIDVYISSDLQSDISLAMDSNCHTMNEQCVQGVRDVIAGPKTELQARNPVIIVSFLVGLISVLFPAIHLASTGDPVPVHIYVPPAQASQASDAATASVTIVTVDNTPSFTITSKPEPTSVTGYVEQKKSHQHRH
jgi:hypothetical protein